MEYFGRPICNKVLPLVYDEALSYYEAIDKLVNKVNECIDKINELEAQIQNGGGSND